MTAGALLAMAWLAAAPAASPGARFEAANRAYLDRDFEAAARGYQDLLGEGWESPALHLNLGNARYRLGKRGAAAASYARALRLDPGDDDARANLEWVRARNVDDVAQAEARPLVLRAADRVPDGAAVAAFGLAWLVLWSALAGRRLGRAQHRGRLGLAAGAAALLAVAGGAVLAGKEASRRTPVAVIVAPATPVRDGPEPALQPAFELHEGAEVRVLEVRGDAVRVRLGSGLEGWIAAADLERV